MSRGHNRAREARGGGRALVVLAALACALPAGAAGEQASQPGSAAAAGLEVGAYHACALVPVASVRCWGYGGDGALGYGNLATIGDDETPARAGPVSLGTGRTVVALSAGSVHTCALLQGGDVRCWGFGGDGRLGYADRDSVGDDEAPAAADPVALGAGRTATAITAGGAHSCAILDDARVRCWGFGGNGQLGYGAIDDIGDDEAPDAAGPVDLGAGRTARAITAGERHTCAILDDRAVRCWGSNTYGQLGYGNTTIIGENEAPGFAGPVRLGTGRTAVAISAGDFHTCAVLDDGAVRCWGFGGSGRLGYAAASSIGDTEMPDAAGPVALGVGRRAVAISAGGAHTCAVLDDGTVRCWGQGRDGRLGYANAESIGDNETPGSAGPVSLGAGRSATAIAAGSESTCARLDDGSVRCWGKGDFGRLGSCGVATIGDDEAPSAAGPLDLGVAGVSAAGCPPPHAPLTAPSPGGDPSPAPILADPPLAAGIAEAAGSNATALALAAQQVRAAALRRCLRGLSRRTRAGARARRTCLRGHGRTPGRVAAPRARATGRRSLELTFGAAGTDRSGPPAARSYLIKQSLRPIRTVADFGRAHALCRGTCGFDVTEVGTPITLTITDLRSRTTYHYAIAARDNVSARVGPRSANSARTR